MNTKAKMFFDAVSSNDPESVRQLLAKDISLLGLKSPGHFGGTALNIAAGRNDRSMTDLLIDAGADPGLKSDWPPGPWNAVQTALSYGHVELARHLVARGATMDVHAAAGLAEDALLTDLLQKNPQRVHERGGDGRQPLSFAANPRIAALLLQSGANRDDTDIDHGSTAAHWAVVTRPAVTRYLVDQGAEPDIFMAAALGDVALSRMLISANPQVLREQVTAERFPDAGNAAHIYFFTLGRNATPLHVAARFNRPALIDLLVREGLPVDTRGDYDQCSALHTAAWMNNVEAIEALVNNGADTDLDSGELHKNAPMGWAIAAGSINAVEVLIKGGARIRDYYRDEAAKGLKGELRAISTLDPQRYQEILDLLGKA